MSLKDFEIGKDLGKGAFGTVCIVKRKEDGQIYAMKRVKIAQLSNKERENALNEVRILASLSHPNIIGYKEAFYDEDSKTLNIVMELADDGDISSKIKKNAKTRTAFPENVIWTWLFQTIQGLKYLHDNKIMHRDLKCANIFLMKNGLLKLGDLNVSKIAKFGMAYTQTGTPYYASPEVWADKPYDYKSDIWSLGCILYEICALKPPFTGNSLEGLVINVKKGIYDPIPSCYSKDLAKIISLMLVVNPSGRPTCEMLLSNEIIQRHMTNPACDIVEASSKNAHANLLCTIKVPRNMNEINRALPKQKRYKQVEEMMEQDEYEAKKVISAKANKNSTDSNSSSGQAVVISSKEEIKKEKINMNIDMQMKKENKNNNNNSNNIDFIPKNNYQMPNIDGYLNNNVNYINQYLQKEKKEISPVQNSPHFNQQQNNPGQQQYMNNVQYVHLLKPQNAIKIDREKIVEVVKPQAPAQAQVKFPMPVLSSNKEKEKDNSPVQINSNKLINKHLVIVSSNPVAKENDSKAKPASNRPQSAKLGGRDYNPIDNPIIRKGISERPEKSPKRILENGKISPSPVVIISSSNNPVNKRPQSGKERVIANMIKEEEKNKKIIYEKINYQPMNAYNNNPRDRIIQVPARIVDPRVRQNNNQGYMVVPGNNKNLLINALKVDETNNIQRGVVIQSNNGPKIVYHKK